MRFISFAFGALLAFTPIVVSAQEPSTDSRTIATYLEEYPGNIFSDYVSILKRTDVWNIINNKDGREYTCFAPTNEAIRAWLNERKYENLESIPLSAADTIAKKHICYTSIILSDFLGDRGVCDQIIPYPNLLDRYLIYRYYPDSEYSPVVNTINDRSNVIRQDYIVSNGIINVIDRVIGQSVAFIPGMLHNNNETVSSDRKATLFYQALQITGLSDTLEQHVDYRYPSPGYDSTLTFLQLQGRTAVEFETGYEVGNQRQRVIWPEYRYYKYTLFVVTDSILENAYGIRTINDLKAKAISVYPEGASLPDTDRNSSLNKLISYHILPCWLRQDQLNYTNPDIVNDYLNSGAKDEIDMQDFYETMHPYAIMRISTPYDQGSGYNGKKVYINRKGTVSAGNLEAEGIRIWTENNYNYTTNGGYYFVDSLLLFDQHTKNALNTRIRVLFSTLSPDFINSGARGRMRTNYYGNLDYVVYSFKDGFCKNVSFSDETLFVVRYQDKNWPIYYHDELMLCGNYDITFRLPPVPVSGLYEIRVTGPSINELNISLNDVGSVLYYIRKENNNFIPCGTPVDLTILSTDSLIGYVSDQDLLDHYWDLSDEEADSILTANDKAMHSRGYMKAPDSYSVSYYGTNLRNEASIYRKIITELYMEAGKDYYLRFRQVNGSPNTRLPLNFLEIVPYSVYSGANGPEDRH